MLNTILEYRKGILFIRLDGSLTKKTISSIKERLINIIETDNLNNLVINMESLLEIDLKGLNLFFQLYELCKKHQGKLFMCGINDKIRTKLKKNKVLHYIKEINTELESFNMIGGLI